jgi:hypothetical protein
VKLIHQGFVREGVGEEEVPPAFGDALRDAMGVVGIGRLP